MERVASSSASSLVGTSPSVAGVSPGRQTFKGQVQREDASQFLEIIRRIPNKKI